MSSRIANANRSSSGAGGLVRSVLSSYMSSQKSSVHLVTTSNRYIYTRAAISHKERVNMLWVLVAFSSICCISLPQIVQAGPNGTYSTNPADYDFGWLANGTWSPGSPPPCTYCVNAFTYDENYKPTPGDQAKGVYWNLTVGTYRCDGVQPNEFWAYDELTHTIVFGNLTEVLCIDAADWNSMSLLKLRYCNSSSVSQQWRKNGSLIISALAGPQGEELFMVLSMDVPQISGSYSDHSKLTLNSFVPSSTSGYSYTADFTFLSRNTLVDTSTDRFTTQGLLGITNYSVDAIVNGGFERGTIKEGSSNFHQALPSYFSLCGWVIDYGPIDYVISSVLPPAEGSYSVHLNTYTDADYWGQVSQTIKTEVGSEYRLSFYFNGFPLDRALNRNKSCNPAYTEAQLQVRITNSTSSGENSGATLSDGFGLQQNFSIDVTSANGPQSFHELWQQRLIMFRALANVTTFSFTSLNFNDSCGPMIDEVTLVRSMRKSTWQKPTFRVIVGCVAGLVLVGILVGMYFGRRRFLGPEEDLSRLYKTESARVFSMKELSTATKKFSAVLGQGGFGTVYKADFPDGTTGAVKVEKLKEHFRSSKVVACAEIAVLLRVHHRNLVNLIGFCIDRGRHMLVFEYLPNGTLYDRLHAPDIPVPPGDTPDSIQLRQLYEKVLPWQKRTKIASDVAYGLEYLHHQADPPVVHRDVKSQNILLTATDSAKLADFGLSKAAPADAIAFPSIQTSVRGSFGYLDPQYLISGVFSAKSDVYSYGVVLLELVSGYEAIHNDASLSVWAAPYLTSPSLYHELVDKKLKGKYDRDELESLVELSKMCTQEDTKLRPNIRQVVTFLNARGLVVPGDQSSETVECETMSREAYHKMQRAFLDLIEEPTVSTESWSGSIEIPRE